jgi:hypothetical protein
MVETALVLITMIFTIGIWFDATPVVENIRNTLRF